MDTSSLVMCTDAVPSFLGIFDFSIAPQLLFYAYIPIILIACAVGFFVFFKDRFSLTSKLLLGCVFSFSLFLLNEIILWTATPAGLILFSWALAPLLRLFILITLLYFIYVFTTKKFPSLPIQLVTILFSLPLIFLLPTSLNVAAIDLYWCEGVNGPLWNYLYILEFVSIGILIITGVKSFFLTPDTSKIQNKQSLYLIFGAAIFLTVFYLSQLFGEYTGIYEVNFVGPLGMLIFLIFLGYSIVKYNTFGIKVLAAQALMVALWFMIGSLLFVAQSSITRLVAGFTLFIAVTLGIILVKSIQHTVKQREEIQKLADRLDKANKQLKMLDQMKSEFVSIASHQLRSPLTSIRGYASMLLEGSYGKLPPKAIEAVERINESSRFMSSSVEDYLNVSRIQAGNMKYEYSDFNLRDIAEQVADDTRQIAMKKGLLLTFRSDLTKKGIVHADIGKTRQVIDNLVNNSLKYTPKGSINIFVHDNPKKKKIYIDVSDTGIGMAPHIINDMFEKFERAENANHVNVTGTGLGLYIARKIAREMGGEVTAASEGEGKGSTFTIELPLMM